MALPEKTYTEAQLARYMFKTLGSVAGVLGITEPVGESAGVFAEAVNDALLDYGTNDIAAATDIRLLRELAAYHAVRYALAEADARFDFSGGGQKFNFSQVRSHLESRLRALEAELSGSTPLVISPVVHVDYFDPPDLTAGGEYA